MGRRYDRTASQEIRRYPDSRQSAAGSDRKAVVRATEKVSLEEGVYGRTHGSLLSVGMRRSLGDSEKPTESITCSRILQAYCRSDIAGVDLADFFSLVGVHLQDSSDSALLALR